MAGSFQAAGADRRDRRRHHRVASRQVVQLVMPAVAPAAVDLQEVLAGGSNSAAPAVWR